MRVTASLRKALGAIALLAALAGCGGGGGAPLSGVGAASEIETGSIEGRAPGEGLPRIERPTLADLLQPGPVPERVLGRTDAPVTLIEYASLTCPYCRAFHEKGLPEIKRRYIDTGQVRLIARDFPIGKSAGAATLALRCVPEGKYFKLLDRLLLEQRTWVSQEVRRDQIFEVARKEGLTRADFDRCSADQKLAGDLNQVKLRGRQLGVVGTPTFFVDDMKLRTSPSLEEIKAAIDAALEKRKVAGRVQ
jgi:protein-disulfide isomerase